MDKIKKSLRDSNPMAILLIQSSCSEKEGISSQHDPQQEIKDTPKNGVFKIGKLKAMKIKTNQTV